MVQSKGLAPGVDPRAIAALKRVGGTTLQTDVTVVLEDTVCTLAFQSHPLKVRDFYDIPQVEICIGLRLNVYLIQIYQQYKNFQLIECIVFR